MRRHARIVASGFPMHVILRGIDRTAFFFAEDDYRALGTLATLPESESVRVHADVLMTKHVPLMVTATDAGPVRLMKSFATVTRRTSTAPTVEPGRSY